MERKASELSERLLEYGAQIVLISAKLNTSYATRHIGKQLLRSGTSAGANYEEACAAESRADFIHKLQIVYKELRETLYWLKLLLKSGLLKNEIIEPVLKETEALNKIIAKSVITVKSRKQ